MRKPALAAQVGHQGRVRVRRAGAVELFGGVGADVAVRIVQRRGQRRDTRAAGRAEAEQCLQHVLAQLALRLALQAFQQRLFDSVRGRGDDADGRQGVPAHVGRRVAGRGQQAPQRARRRAADLTEGVGGPGAGVLAGGGEALRQRRDRGRSHGAEGVGGDGDVGYRIELVERRVRGQQLQERRLGRRPHGAERIGGVEPYRFVIVAQRAHQRRDRRLDVAAGAAQEAQLAGRLQPVFRYRRLQPVDQRAGGEALTPLAGAALKAVGGAAHPVPDVGPENLMVGNRPHVGLLPIRGLIVPGRRRRLFGAHEHELLPVAVLLREIFDH